MEEVNKLLDHLNTGRKRIEELGKQNHLVLTVGVTGSGKSTFILYVAGYDDQLTAKELIPDSGEFVIEDAEGRISDADSTLCSQTFFPEIYRDRDSSSNLVYCDCPGFEDTRTTIVDMANAYFIQTIFASSVAVKIVFVVSYSSLRVGVNRTDLKTLVEHATSLIRDIDKMKNSICLAVTKVDNTYLKDGNLVSDETVVQTIAGFIEKAINSAQQMEGQWSADFLAKFRQFLGIFLSKDEEGNYTKICIFRRPDESGRVKDISSMVQRKIAIKKVLTDNILFQNCSPSDFGLSIKHESQNELYLFLDHIQGNFISFLKEISDTLLQEQHEFILANFDISDIINYIDNCRKVFQCVVNELNNEMDPRSFIRILESSFQELGISRMSNLCKQMYELTDYFDKLTPLSKKKVSYRTLEWSKALQDILLDYLNSRCLYEFFQDLWTSLLEYEVQCTLKMHSKSKIEDTCSSTFPCVTSLMSYLKSFRIHPHAPLTNISNKVLHESDAGVVKEILQLTLMNETSVCQEGGLITVNGGVVMLSDLSQLITKRTKGIFVFAKTKVFIDDDLNLKGRGAEVVIISPIWEVVGSRKIVLDGNNGKPRDKAKNGEEAGSNGENGKPGRPGECGGHFFGIVDQLIHGDALCISSNGGDGGQGQDGGDGAMGKTGKSGERSSSSLENVSRDVFELIVFTSSKSCKVYKGEKGGHGGDGGNGGVGGFGGQPGTIVIKKCDPSVNIQVEVAYGKNAVGGMGGKGDKGGRDGDDLLVYEKTLHILKMEISSETGDSEYRKARSYGEHGNNGKNGFNNEGMLLPEPVPQTDLSEIISQYLDFLNENQSFRIQKHEMERFVDFIKECY